MSWQGGDVLKPVARRGEVESTYPSLGDLTDSTPLGSVSPKGVVRPWKSAYSDPPMGCRDNARSDFPRHLLHPFEARCVSWPFAPERLKHMF